VARYADVTTTTASVTGSGGSLDFDIDIPNDVLDIYKIGITPSGGTGTSVFSIFKDTARAVGDLIYKTLPWDVAAWFDPVEDISGTYYSRGEGFVCRYEDVNATKKLHCTIVNNDASARTYNVTVTTDLSPFTPGASNVPSGLRADMSSNGLHIMTLVTASINSATIDLADFRAICIPLGTTPPGSEDLRIAAEGGTFADNGTTQLVVDNIPANAGGASYSFTSAQAGRWFFAWRLHNTAGWSNWTDGNEDPSNVTQWIDTTSNSDTGPAAGWQVSIENGPRENTVIVHATRPTINGNAILGIAVQVKDSTTGSWRAIDANTGAAETYYDGSGSNASLDPATGLFSNGGGGWGTASPGDVIMMDIKGDGTFDIEDCIWGIVKTIGTTLELYSNIVPLPTAHTGGGVYDQIRLKIVKPIWNWDSEGYMAGWEPGGGYWDFSQALSSRFTFPDYTSTEFVSDPIPIDPTSGTVEARVYFINGYGSITDGNIIKSSGIVGGGDVLDGYTWTKFTDRNWWIPTTLGNVNDTFTLETNGQITLTNVTNDVFPAYNFGGVVARFKVFHSKDGRIILRVKHHITGLTTSTDNNDMLWGMILAMDGAYDATYNPDYYYGFMATHSELSGNQKLFMSHCRGIRLSTGITGDFGMGNVSSPDFSMAEDIALPSMPFDLDLRLTIEETADLGTDIGIRMAWKTYEYQVDAGGWNTISPLVGSPYQYDQMVPLYFKGIQPMIGMFTMKTKVGDSVTLTEFAVEEGLCVRF
jgi:hypothetical protein